MTGTDMRFENVLTKVDTGLRWQIRMLFITSVPLFFSGINNLGGGILLFYSPDHWCDVVTDVNRTFDRDELARNNWTESRVKQYAIPKSSSIHDGSYSECEFYDANYTAVFDRPWSRDLALNDTVGVRHCHRAWIYDQSEMKSTVITEWNLVCDNTNLASTAISAYQIGTFLGAITFGYLSDRFGRRKIAMVTIVQATLSCLAVAFAPNYIVLIIGRMLAGMATVASCHCGFILLGETIKPGSRGPYQMAGNVFYAVGIILASLVAYMLPNWRLFSLVSAIATSTMISFYWFLPESPRWLILNGKLEDAWTFVRQIADISGRQDIKDDDLKMMIGDCYKTMLKEEEEQPKTYSYLPIVSLFQNPEMRKLATTHGFLWAFLSCTYYGISFASPKFGSNVFLVLFLTGLSELPAAVFGPFLVKYSSRRLSMCSTLTLAGICCLFYLIIPRDMVWLQTTVVMIARLIVALVYCIIYVAAAESFPTNHRQIGLGFCSTCSRVGSISSAYIVNSLGQNSVWYAMLVFGVQLIVSGGLTLLLKETANKGLPENEKDVTHYDEID